MRNFTKLILALFIAVLSLLPDRVEASHLKGGDTYFVSLGNGQYELVFACYYACEPTSIAYDTAAADFSWTITSSCSSVPTFITAASSTPPKDVPLYCSGVLTQCDYYSQLLADSLGTPYANAPPNAPVGTLVITYTSAPFSIPPGCTVSAVMDFSARNAAILNLVNPAGNDINIQASITTPANGAANNNPQFAQYPVNVFCVGRSANFSQGAIDLNGDSLTYTLINPRGGGGIPIAFVPGCTPTNPLGVGNGTGFASSFSFDPNTGNINFTPTATGDFVLSVQVNDYHNGVLVGSTMRDIQFSVILCNTPTTPPSIGSGFTTTNVTGATVIDSNHLGICPGETVTIDLMSVDVDSFAYIIDTTNVLQSLPGSTLTVTHSGAIFDTAVMHITWTPTAADSGYHYFIVTATDTFCPNPGRNTYGFVISFTSVTAGPNQVYCNGGQPVTIYATGSNHYLWTDSATGGPPVGVLSYGPDSSYIVVAPGSTTGYVVRGDLLGTCRNTDTVTIVNAPIFTLTASALDTSICKYTTTQITTTPSPAGVGPFTYSWSPASGVVSPTSGTTMLTPIHSTTMFYVTVTAAQGCAIRDSIRVSVNGAAPQVIIVPSDNNVCPGDTITLNSQVFAENLVFCGTVDTCVTNNNLVSVAVSNDTSSSTGGTFGTAVYCSPFMGSFNSFKAQYLFTKAELNAAGLSSGSITDISFFVKQVLSTAPYDTFVVSMGCTDQDSLTGFVNNLMEVVPPQVGPNAITPNQGWTPLPFTHFYNWDGSSNIVVQICYTIDPGITSQDDYVSYSTTPYMGSSLIAGDYNFFGPPYFEGCGLDVGANLYTPLNTRPNIKFGQCVPNILTYHWAPATLVCDTCPSTQVIVNANSTYTLTVADGICSNHNSTQLTINPNIGVAITPAVVAYCDGNPAQLNVALSNPPVSQCIEGYTVSSIPYAPISGTSTVISGGDYLDDFGFNQTDDATAGPYGIGFNFPFYCQSYSQFYVNTNGWLTFQYPYPATPQTQEYTAVSLPTVPGDLYPMKTIELLMGNYYIADTFGDGGGNIAYFVTGTAPNRVLVVQFNNMADELLIDTTSGEMHLYESTGVIDLLLKYSNYTGTPHTAGINDSTGLGMAVPGINDQLFADSTAPLAWRFTPQYGPSVALISALWSPNQYLNNNTITNPLASPPASQEYYVTDTLIINQFTHPTKCVVRDSIQVNIGHFNGDSISASPTTVCPGGTSQITFTAVDPITSYTWTPASGLSSATIADPTATVTDTTEYFINVISAAGCQVTDSVTIIATPLPTVILKEDSTACNCSQNVAVVPIITGGSPAFSYEWSDGTTGATTIDTGIGTTVYTLTVTDANHCTVVSNTGTYTMNCPKAAISMRPVSDTIFLHDTAILSATVVQGYTYQWTSDTTLTVLTANIDSTPVIGQVRGMDTVHLLVTDGNGCKYNGIQVINVVEFGNFAMATAFTPNGDGKNDYFYPVFDGPVTVSRFNIYDRWGQLVYDNPNPPGWDGNFKSKQEPSETYVYFITVEYPDPNNAARNIQRSVQGSFQLFR